MAKWVLPDPKDAPVSSKADDAFHVRMAAIAGSDESMIRDYVDSLSNEEIEQHLKTMRRQGPNFIGYQSFKTLIPIYEERLA